MKDAQRSTARGEQIRKDSPNAGGHARAWIHPFGPEVADEPVQCIAGVARAHSTLVEAVFAAYDWPRSFDALSDAPSAAIAPMKRVLRRYERKRPVPKGDPLRHRWRPCVTQVPNECMCFLARPKLC